MDRSGPTPDGGGTPTREDAERDCLSAIAFALEGDPRDRNAPNSERSLRHDRTRRTGAAAGLRMACDGPGPARRAANESICRWRHSRSGPRRPVMHGRWRSFSPPWPGNAPGSRQSRRSTSTSAPRSSPVLPPGRSSRRPTGRSSGCSTSKPADTASARSGCWSTASGVAAGWVRRSSRRRSAGPAARSCTSSALRYSRTIPPRSPCTVSPASSRRDGAPGNTGEPAASYGFHPHGPGAIASRHPDHVPCSPEDSSPGRGYSSADHHQGRIDSCGSEKLTAV